MRLKRKAFESHKRTGEEMLGSNFNKEVKTIPIIRITTDIGKGTATEPYRTGFEYWDTKGKLLFVTEADESD